MDSNLKRLSMQVNVDDLLPASEKEKEYMVDEAFHDRFSGRCAAASQKQGRHGELLDHPADHGGFDLCPLLLAL